MDFPTKLRAWRKKHGITQAQAGELLHVDKTTITRWEAGTRRPPKRMRLSEAMIRGIIDQVEP